MPGFPFYKQLDSRDCGPACLRMVAKYYGKNFSLQNLREKIHINRQGTSLLGIADAAESIGLKSTGLKISFKQLAKEAPLPCIVHWKQRHFVVVYKISKNPSFFQTLNKKREQTVFVADPAFGKIKYNEKEFTGHWTNNGSDETSHGICLLLNPTPAFSDQEVKADEKTNLRFLFQYIKPYSKYFIQLLLALVFGSLLQLIFPFLTQSLVDIGINNQDLDFITLILIAHLFLYFSQASVEFIRSWILLHISTRINISLISDFLLKLMKLPIGFFDSKTIGDLMQRISDHTRIESFLTVSSLQVLFSITSFIIFGLVLAIYSIKIFLVFVLGTIFYVAWVLLFMKRRRQLDSKKFAQMSDNQSNLFQIINGMQEIKLNNCEKQKRWEWETIQAGLFKTNISNLSLEQYQRAGGVFFNQAKNILITFIAAYAVVKGEITLGMMLAIQYIIGQLNAPVEQIIGFMRSAQDAKISLERLQEIHLKEDENAGGIKKNQLPVIKDIHIKNVDFQYEGPRSPKVFKNLNLLIPENKITAIVGMSGSGKTTLLKLLLAFYQPQKGNIRIHDTLYNSISGKTIRSNIGAVMQDGYIFSDSIARNIAIGEEYIDEKKLHNSIKISSLEKELEVLPLGYDTKIGSDGIGLSQGQKQRILIARAVYKNPEYLFFDEATNALDANNERVIMQNLMQFFKGKTVVIVAHRLSTVTHADQIVVLDKGHVVEIGSHKSLTAIKGEYYKLVKNQLEMGL